MSIKKLLLLFISYVPTLVWAQASYMHEAQEDSGNPITGLLGLILLGVIAYFIIFIKDLYDGQQKAMKQNEIESNLNREHKQREEEKIKRKKIIEEKRLNSYRLWENNIREIDLGLSVKWADCNLGANSPIEYGFFFPWGEIREKQEKYDGITHLFGNGLQLSYDECKEIGGNNLYDPVAKWIGKGWQLPSKKEYEELITNCRWEETMVENVKGYYAIGPNGNKIFFRFTDLNVGEYWTSTSHIDEDEKKWAYMFGFGYYLGNPSLHRCNRDACFVIRPILKI